jgi:hypothetical protein
VDCVGYVQRQTSRPTTQASVGPSQRCGAALRGGPSSIGVIHLRRRWPEGTTVPGVTAGIEDICNLVAEYSVDPVAIGDQMVVYTLVVLEVRGGKIANQWVSSMFR